MRRFAALILLATPLPAIAQDVPAQHAVTEVSIDQLRSRMDKGQDTSVDITRAYLDRIGAMDRKGPALRAIIALNPDALAQAKASDARRKAKKLLGPLDGIPILIKDNIETKDPVPTTAGSLALKDNLTHRDAPVIALLRAQGAVILGKTNLSEWANIRSTKAMSGWSGIGGLVRNPYGLDRTACGSSSGTGAAVAASFAAAGLGTETDGSVVCPSSINGLVAMPGWLTYNCSKAAVVEMSKSMAMDLAPFNIRVNCVCPGVTDTPALRRAIADLGTTAEAVIDGLMAPRCLIKRFARPEEIAAAALFLASDEASYVTGAIFAVDGGYTA